MAMDLFKLLGRIVVDNSDAIDAMKDTTDEAKKTGNALSDTGGSGEKSSGKLSKAFSKIGNGVVKAGKVAVTGLAATATAIGGVTVSALNAAGELEQNMGGSEAVFKSLGDSIDKMQTTIITGYDKSTGKAIKSVSNLETVSKTAYKNMGVSQSDYLATVNKMGSLFQGSGFEAQESLDMASQAMQRAADVASIMGIDVDSAMESIAGAAKGNFTIKHCRAA